MNARMNMTRKKSLMIAMLLVCAVLAIAGVPEIVYAQAPLPPQEPDQAPIGGLGVLAVAGGAYAVKKLRDKKAV